ncbi:MAG: hypothetical protein JW958_07885 [Candidatus Eisenbacteria bacterium]|nr:hypothetical protein [Candidatus Eisenbacteria bacterium]
MGSLTSGGALDLWTRPLSRGGLARETLRLRLGSAWRSDPVLLGFLEEMEEELDPEIAAIRRGGDPGRAWTSRTTFRLEARDRERGAVRAVWIGDLAVRLGNRLAWHQRMEIASREGDDLTFDGKVWKRGITGRFTHAYAAFRIDPVRVTAGRRSVAWGNGIGGSLLLQGGSPPLDGFGVEGRIGPVDFSAFTAELDDRPADSTGTPARRFLSGHRVSLRLGNRARIALSETVLYGGVGRDPEWDYANPLLSYYAAQWNRNRDDNVFWSMDGTFRVREELDVYGEFLVDDFQYDFETEPNQIAFLAGARLKRLPGAPGFFFDLEYVRVNNWVYGHEHNWNRYMNGDAMLGHPIGPDADRTTARLAWRRGACWDVTARWDFLREGEGSIDDPRDSAVPFGSTFLGGDVVRTTLPALRVDWHPEAGRRFSIGWERNGRKQWVVSLAAEIRFARTAPITDLVD